VAAEQPMPGVKPDGRGLWNSGRIRLTNRPTNQSVYRRLVRIAAAKAVSMKSLMRE
jgi:hypothetical protein